MSCRSRLDASRARIALAAVLGLLVLAALASVPGALAACGALDRWFGRSGCVAAIVLPNLRDLGHTVTRLPGSGLLAVAGTSRTSPGGPYAAGRLVLYDPAAARETARYALPVGPRIADLAASPDGRHVAAMCDLDTKCDVAPMYLPDGLREWEVVLLAVIDLQAFSVFADDSSSRTVRQPELDADGRAVVRAVPRATLPAGSPPGSAFSLDGGAVRLGSVAWPVRPGAEAGAPVPPAPRAVMEHDGVSIEMPGGLTPLRMELPPGFRRDAEMSVALSGDGAQVALLLRARGGVPRAVLHAWRTRDGARLAHHAIPNALAPALAWTPDGGGLVVALADDEPDATLRVYAAEEGARARP